MKFIKRYFITILLSAIMFSNNPIMIKINYMCVFFGLTYLIGYWLYNKHIEKTTKKLMTLASELYPDANDLEIIDLKLKKNGYNFTLLINDKIYDNTFYNKKDKKFILEAS